MADLNIGKASIGYDKDQLSKTYQNLRAQCIEETIQIMKKNANGIYQYVNQAWVGTSADQFKTNFGNDIVYVYKKLNEVSNRLKAQFDNIVKTMNSQEDNIVKKRNGGKA